jgi:hypothetical protein
MTPVRTRLAGAVLAAALLPAGGVALAPGAGASEASHSSAAHASSAAALTPLGTRAAQLRSTLAATFQAHTAFAAITQSAYLTKGETLGRAAEAVTAARRQELAASVGGTSQQTAALRDALAAWDAAKLSYAFGVDRYRGSHARAATAQRAVVATRGRVVTALAPLVPSVPRAELAALLAVQDARDAAATRALGARSPLVFQLVHSAHLGTAALARRVAVAVDARDALPGSVTSPAAELRASTVNLHVAHVVQTGLASDAGLTYGLRSAAYAGAVAALQSNTAALTIRVRQLSDPANAAAFRAQWERHIRDYATYVAGWINEDPALRRAADADLQDFARDNAPQLSRVSGIPAAALVPEIRVHVRGTERVIDLQAVRSPQQFPVAAAGTMHFAMVGDRLAASAAARLRIADPA